MIAVVSNWKELGISLGMDTIDIDIIKSEYEPREYHQRLVEMWFSRELEISWEKLQRALEEVSKRQGSQTKYSLPSTESSSLGTYKYEGECTDKLSLYHLSLYTCVGLQLI